MIKNIPESHGASIGQEQDPFTGEIFTPRTVNHYEHNDGIPVAPVIETPRLTLRQRVEALLRSGQPIPGYEGDNDDEWDEEDEPLTQAEKQYLNQQDALERRQAALEAAKRQEATPPPPAEPKPASEAPKPEQPGVASPPASTTGT